MHFPLAMNTFRRKTLAKIRETKPAAAGFWQEFRGVAPFGAEDFTNSQGILVDFVTGMQILDRRRKVMEAPPKTASAEPPKLR